MSDKEIQTNFFQMCYENDKEDIPVVKFFKDVKDKDKFLDIIIMKDNSIERSIYFSTRLMTIEEETVIKKIIEYGQDDYIFAFMCQLTLLDDFDFDIIFEQFDTKLDPGDYYVMARTVNFIYKYFSSSQIALTLKKLERIKSILIFSPEKIKDVNKYCLSLHKSCIKFFSKK
jgi:hypothetical protein